MVADSVETEIFAMSRKKFAWVLTVLYGAPWIWTVVAVFACGVVLGFTFNIAWGLGCVFLVFLIVPLAMTYLYYSYALRTPTFMNILPHRFSMRDGMVSVCVYFKEKEEEGEESVENKSVENKGDEYVRSYVRYIRCEDFGRIYIFPDGIAVKTVNPEAGFLWFTPHVFESVAQFNAVIEGIAAKSR